MDDEMDLQDRVFFVNSRWIETNRTLAMADLVNHCRAELELKQRHLAEAEQLAEELGADTNLSDHRGYQWRDLWESVGSNHVRWIACHPDSNVHELLDYLEAAKGQCEDVCEMSIEDSLDYMGEELSVWYGAFPQDGDLSESTAHFFESISEDIEDVHSLSLIVAKDFKVSDLPKPRWMIQKLHREAVAAKNPKARKAVLV